MKKLILVVVMLLSVASARAQFEVGTKYVGAGLTGLGLSYSNGAKFQMGLSAEAGYFFADSWMVKGTIGYDHKYKSDQVNIGAGVRYYFPQNGIFLGTGLSYDHYTPNLNSVAVPIEVGYCFYLNHHVALEPAVYYKVSLNNFADCSTVGLRVGFGYFF